MPRRYISENTKQAVEERAKGRCEYCQSWRKFSPQPFIIEHIIPTSKGGADETDNLALSCGGCNGHKYQKTEALDPVSGKLATFFNPRKDDWSSHFEWDADYLRIIGLTPSGRATVNALHLNRKELIYLREILLLAGKHPAEE